MRFSEAVDANTAQVAGNYLIGNSAASSAALSDDPTVVLLTTSDISDGANLTLNVSNVTSAGDGSTIAPNSQVSVRIQAELPHDVHTVVNGFQDEFLGDTRNPLWQKISGAGGADNYLQGGGLLSVSVAGGDPNHLLYTAQGYDPKVQEILALIRITDWLGDLAVGGIAVGVPPEDSKGMNVLFLNGGAFPEGGTDDILPNRHLRFLNDFHAFGTRIRFDWTENEWYWVRLRQEANLQAGQPDAFAKVWRADGDTPEPTDWMANWDIGRDTKNGFAGFRAGFAGSASYDVDYVLIKAAGLPQVATVVQAFEQGPVNIIMHPQNVAVTPGQSATFRVAASGAGPFTYQWLRGGSVIGGATSDSYTIASAAAGDDNATFSVRVGNSFGEVTSNPATLSVRSDAIPPTLVSARRWFSDHAKVTVVFSEMIAPGSIANLGNYGINNNITVSGASVGSTPESLVLTTTPLEEGNNYTLTVSGVQDPAGNPIAANSTIAISLSPVVPSDFNTTVAGYQDDFEGSARNPAWMAIGPDTYQQSGGVLNVKAGGGDPNHLIFADPRSRGTVQEILALVKMDNFTTHEHAFGGVALGVPEDSLTHDPKGGINMLFANPGAFGGSANKHFRFLSDYRGFGPEVNMPWQTGPWYWLRLRQDPNASGGSADVFGKVWAADGDTPEPSNWQGSWDYPDIRDGFAAFRAGIKSAQELIADWQVDYVLIKASGLPQVTVLPRAFQTGAIVIVQNPARVRVGAGQQAVNLSVGVQGAGPYEYQWYKEGVAINGATGSTYTIASPVEGDAGNYTVKVSNAFSEATSSPAELIVDADNGTAPSLVSARRMFSNHSKVKLLFSEPVRSSTATVPSNYQIQPTLPVSGAELVADNEVVLTTAPIANAPEHKVVVNGVTDLFGNPVAASSQAVIAIAPYLPNDVGVSVAGYQDDFDAPARDPRWVVAIGPDVYVQRDGYMNVGSGSSDPNHLLFNDTYDLLTQEILARIEILTAVGENPLGVAAGVPNESGEHYSKGMNLLFLNPNSYGGPGVPHLRFLDDYRAFGSVLDYQWQQRKWYWLRLRIEPNAGGGAADAFGKVWPADGDSPEPQDWQQVYDSQPELRPGLAGFRATYENRPGTYRVDWALIKAAGLPSITPSPKVFAPDNVLPTIVSARRGFTDPTVVTVEFSENLDPGSAQIPSGYQIDRGVLVSNVSLGSDGKTVTLTTSPIGDTGIYKLTVNGVHDASGNAIAVNSTINISLPPSLPDPEARVQDGGADGLLVLEAEHFTASTAGQGHNWNFVESPVEGYSGTGVVQSLPNDPQLNVQNDVANSPRMDYKVIFAKTGTHYIWIRGIGDSAPGPSTDDSMHVGLDGELFETSRRISGFTQGAGYIWTSSRVDPAVDLGPARFNVGIDGLHVLNVWMRENGLVVDKIVITTNPNYVPTGAGPAESPLATPPPRYQHPGADGLVVLEAEHNTGSTTAQGHTWTLVTAPAGFVADGAMQALPNDPPLNVQNDVAISPRMDFKVNFAKTGTHYIWVRGSGDSAPGPSADDSVHVGLDGQLFDTSRRISGFPLGAGYVWSSGRVDPTVDVGPARLDVSATGEHVINVWMRENGLVVDRILLTTNPNYTPSGVGPEESSTQPPAEELFLEIQRAGDQITILWDGTAKLERAGNILGPWEIVSGAQSPYRVNTTDNAGYFRLSE